MKTKTKIKSGGKYANWLAGGLLNMKTKTKIKAGGRCSW